MVNMNEILAKIGMKNPWPKQKPDVEEDDHSWFLASNRYILGEKLVHPETRVLELGAWLGASTRFFAERAQFTVTIDHWLGSAEHRTPARADIYSKLPTLYETFIVNCWEYRDVLLPLRMSTQAGMKLLLEKGVEFDLIYIDADHSYEGVLRDMETAEKFPGLPRLTGDDWGWGHDRPIQKAVTEFTKKRGLKFHHHGNFWWIDR